MADGGEDGVGGVAGSSLEIAAAKMALSLHMADHGLDGGTAAQLALDGAEHAALLSGDEDPMRVCCIVAAVSFVDIGALDLAPGESFGIFDLTDDSLLPSYSPDFNPIEQFFAKLKALLRKAAVRTIEALITAIADALTKVSPQECENYLANQGYSRKL